VKQVTLYTANKQQVMSYDLKALHQYKYPPMQDLLPVYGSDKVLDKSTVEKISLPIERFCWSSGKEIFAAFDEELREIIGCSQEKFKQDVEIATDRRVKQEYSQLLAVKDELKTLHNLSVLDSIKWSIRKLWSI
jgi:hypothetical protein